MERFLFLSCNQLGTAGSTRQMPYGLRWETLIEGLRESNSHQNKREEQQKKDPKVTPTPRWCPAPKRSVNSVPIRSCVSQCADELCSFLATLNTFRWKNIPSPPQLWKAKKPHRNNCFVFILRKKLPTQRTWALLKVA